MKLRLISTLSVALIMLSISPNVSGATTQCHLNEAVPVICATADAWGLYDFYDNEWDLYASGGHWSLAGVSVFGELSVTSTSTTFGGHDVCVGSIGDNACGTRLSSFGLQTSTPGGLCILAVATTFDAGLAISAQEGFFC